jgi:hypothetical protein
MPAMQRHDSSDFVACQAYHSATRRAEIGYASIITLSPSFKRPYYKQIAIESPYGVNEAYAKYRPAMLNMVWYVVTVMNRAYL